MIYCSDDIDPTDLVTKYLGGAAVKVPLMYGDFTFSGKGWGGEEISISVERKRIRDLINSLVLGKRLVQQMRDARMAHQVLYLIVEGLYKDVNGMVGTFHGWGKDGEWHPLNCGTEGRPIYVEYDRLEQSLESLSIVQGVQVRWTANPEGTAKRLINLHRWWQRPPETHTTTQAFYSGPMPLAGKLSLVRRVAKELPGVGWEISGRVERRFATVRDMVNAPPEEWERIDGIGAKTSKNIDMALREGRDA